MVKTRKNLLPTPCTQIEKSSTFSKSSQPFLWHCSAAICDKTVNKSSASVSRFLLLDESDRSQNLLRKKTFLKINSKMFVRMFLYKPRWHRGRTQRPLRVPETVFLCYLLVFEQSHLIAKSSDKHSETHLRSTEPFGNW